MRTILKYLFAATLFACSTSAAMAYAPSGGDTIVKKCFLDMRGQISFGKKTLPEAIVTVYYDSSSTLVQKIESDEKGWVAFRLPVQRFYTVKISKPGFVTKIISVDTKMPSSSQTGDYYFEFSVDLFEEIKDLDVSVLNHPVAKIFFNSFIKKFDFDFNYTAKINSEIKKMYDNYRLLRKRNSENSAVKRSEVTTDSTGNKK